MRGENLGKNFWKRNLLPSENMMVVTW